MIPNPLTMTAIPNFVYKPIHTSWSSYNLPIYRFLYVHRPNNRQLHRNTIILWFSLIFVEWKSGVENPLLTRIRRISAHRWYHGLPAQIPRLSIWCLFPDKVPPCVNVEGTCTGCCGKGLGAVPLESGVTATDTGSSKVQISNDTCSSRVTTHRDPGEFIVFQFSRDGVAVSGILDASVEVSDAGVVPEELPINIRIGCIEHYNRKWPVCSADFPGISRTWAWTCSARDEWGEQAREEEGDRRGSHFERVRIFADVWELVINGV